MGRLLLSRTPRAFLEHLRNEVGMLSTASEVRAFLRSCFQPQKQSCRINTLKVPTEIARKHLVDHLGNDGWLLTPVPWCRDGFYLERKEGSQFGPLDSALGLTTSHLQGLIYGQEAASMLPVEVLRTLFPTEDRAASLMQRGPLVLDLCSAPGSKATQLGAWLSDICSAGAGDIGLLVANDPAPKRHNRLRVNLLRCGLVNRLLTSMDGRLVGDRAPETFDIVLVDAPCSSEGNMRKYPHVLARWWNRHHIRDKLPSLAAQQRELVASGWRALRPGGVLIYSTCTLNAIENEEVCRWLLRESQTWGRSSVAQPVNLGGLPPFECLSTKEGFLRVWPHRDNAEGFFVACFRKVVELPDTQDEHRDLSDILINLLDNKSCSKSLRQLEPLGVEGEAVLRSLVEQELGVRLSRYGDATFMIDNAQDVWMIPRSVLRRITPLSALRNFPLASPASCGLLLASLKNVTGEGGYGRPEFQLSDELQIFAGGYHASECTYFGTENAEKLAELEARVCGSLGSFNALMAFRSARGDAHGAEVLFREIERSKLVPDLLSYTTLLSAHAEGGHAKRAAEVMATMAKVRCTPNVVTYNALLKAYCRNGDHAGLDRCVDSMEKASVSLDLVSWNTLLDACVKCAGVKNIHAARQIMSRMRIEDVAPNIVSYNTLLNVYSSVGTGVGDGSLGHSALALLAEMRSYSVTPNVVSYTTLVKVYALSRNTIAATEAFVAMEQWRLEPGLHGYNTLLEAYACAGDLEGTRRYLDEMRLRSLNPDAVSYSCLMKSHLRRGDGVDAATSVLTEMEASSVAPTHMIYSILMGAHARNGAVEDVQRLLAHLCEQRFPPNLHHWTALVKAKSVLGDADGAWKSIRELISQCLRPDLVCINTLLEAHARGADADGAWRVFTNMNEWGLRPNLISFNTLVKARARSGDWTGCSELLAFMFSSGPFPDSRSYGPLLGAKAEKGDVVGVMGLLEEMRSLKIRPDKRAVDTLGLAQQRARQLRVAPD